MAWRDFQPAMSLSPFSFIFFLVVAGASEVSNFGLGCVFSLLDTLLNADDVLLVLLHIRQDVRVVNSGGAARNWVEEPDEEDQLEEEVEWDESKDKAGELVDNVEESEYDPVCEPLLIVIGALRLESEEGHEAGVGDTEQARDVSVTDAKHYKDDASNQTVAR